MKILLLNDDFPPESTGGAAIVVDRLAQGLLKKGHQVQLITTSQTKAQTETRGSLKIHWLTEKYPLQYRAYLSLYRPSVLRKIKKILESYQPDVVHVHNLHTYLSYASIKLFSRNLIPVIFTGHDVMPVFYNRRTQFVDADGDGIPDTLDYHFHFLKEAWQNKLHFNPLRNHVIRHYLSFTKIVTVSTALKELYQANGLRVNTVIHNGVSSPTTITEQEIKKWRISHKLENKKILLFAGRVRSDKGIFHALEFLHQLPPEIILAVAGKHDSVVQELQKKTHEQNLSHRLSLLGDLDQNQLEIAYAVSDLVLVPSVCFDSFPNAVVEAMNLGKVVAASPFGGAKEIIIDQQTGLLINPFDLKKSTQSILEILKQPQRAQKIGQQAESLIRQELNQEAWVNRYLDLYQQ